MITYQFLGINGSSQDLYGGNTSLLIRGKSGKTAVDLSCNLEVLVDEDVDCVILTHEHIDHIYALPSLLHQMWIGGRTRGIDIYVPTGMEALVESFIDLFALRSKKGMFDIRVCAALSLEMGTLHITMFPTNHTGTSMGIAVEEDGRKLVYTSDTRPIEEIPECFDGADVLIHEASGVEENKEVLVKKGHSSGADAGYLAKKLGVKKLYLCHLPKGETKTAVFAEAGAVFEETVLPEVLKLYHI